MHFQTDSLAPPSRFVAPLFQDPSQVNFDAAALWPHREIQHMRKLLAAADDLGVKPLPEIPKDANALSPASRQDIQRWLQTLSLSSLCRDRPEAARVFMDAVHSAHEAYRGQVGDRTMRGFLQYTLNVLEGNLNPHPEDLAVRQRAAQLEMHYGNTLTAQERQSFAAAQRVADRTMDPDATKGYGDIHFHEQHPDFWRHLTIIRRVRNMARDVMEDRRTLEAPHILPKGRDWTPIATRHPTYRLSAEQRACASQLRLILEGGSRADAGHAVELMNGMVGKDLKKPTIVDEMKLTAIDTRNDFVGQLDRLRDAQASKHHFHALSQQSKDMSVWTAFDQDVDAPAKLTGCMEEMSCRMRQSKWEVIVAELKSEGASPALLARAQQTCDYWTQGVQWWDKNRQVEVDRRNKVIQSTEPFDASLVDVTRHPDYPRIEPAKIGGSEKASDERDALLALLAAEGNPRLAALARLVEIKGLGANGEFRISGTGPRGFWERGADGKLQAKPGAMRMLQERRWELDRLDGGDVSRIIVAEYTKGTLRALHDEFDKSEFGKTGLPMQFGPHHRPDGISVTPLVEDDPNVSDSIEETDQMLQYTQQTAGTGDADIPKKISSKIAGSDFPKRNGQVRKMRAQMQMQANLDRLQKLNPRAEISMRLGSGETEMRGGGPRSYRDVQAGLVHMPSSGGEGEPRSIIAQTVQGVGMDRSFMTPMAAQASRLRYERLCLQAFDDVTQLKEMTDLATELDQYIGGLEPRLCEDPAYETLLADNPLVKTLGHREVGGSRGQDPADDFKGPLKMRTIRVVRTYRDVGMLPWYNSLLAVPQPLLDRLAADARRGGRFGSWFVASLFHEANQADPALLRRVVGHDGGLAGEANREKLRVVDTLGKAHDHLCKWLRDEGFALRQPDDVLIAAPGALLTQQMEGLGLAPDSDYEAVERALRQQRLERRSVVELAALKIPPTATDHASLAARHNDLIAKLQMTHRLHNSTDGEG